MSDYKDTEPRFVRQMTLADFDRIFPDEKACWNYLLLRRWPEGPHCPRCDNAKLYECGPTRPWHWQCKKCGKDNRSPYRFSLKTGTIFEETKVALLTWYKVLYFMLASKKGISALQIHRMIGSGSYRTAWYMCMRLRAAMKDPEFQQLMGIVEVNETAISGKDKNRHWNKKQHITGMSGKTTVIGAISRKGNVVCQIIESTDAKTLNRFVRKAVNEKVSLVATDEHGGYHYLNALGYKHETVKHSQNEYVRGEIHTNNIESFWALLKRGIVGTYHNVSKKYLPLYFAEFQFRHNSRRESDIFGKAIEGA
jgi:transposase-like protein